MQLHLGMKLLAVGFVWFLRKTCTEERGGGGGGGAGGEFRPKIAKSCTVFYHKMKILLSKYFKEHTTI